MTPIVGHFLFRRFRMRLVHGTGEVDDQACIFPHIPYEYNNVHFAEEIAMYWLTRRVLMVWGDVLDTGATGLRLMEELPDTDGEEGYHRMLTNIPIKTYHLAQVFAINNIILSHVQEEQILFDVLEVL